MMIASMVPAMAAGDGTITIHNAVAGHTYTAYKIFGGNWDAGVAKLSDVTWGNGISDAGKTALYAAYNLTADADKTAEKFANAIGTDDAAAQAFANHIGEGDNLGTGTAGAFDTTTPTDYVISGLEDGYYMIVDTYTPANGEDDVYYARYMIQKVGHAELQGTAPNYEGTPKYNKVAYTTPSVQETNNTTFQVTSGSDGIIELKGLHEGTYTFTEIQAPDGYNLLTKPIIVTITSNIATISSPSAFAWSATKREGTDGTASDLTLTQINNSDVYEFTFNVENASGSTLPSTGGIGTTIFYVGGSVLVLAAAILLITKRRMSNND